MGATDSIPTALAASTYSFHRLSYFCNSFRGTPSCAVFTLASGGSGGSARSPRNSLHPRIAGGGSGRTRSVLGIGNGIPRLRRDPRSSKSQASDTRAQTLGPVRFHSRNVCAPVCSRRCWRSCRTCGAVSDASHVPSRLTPRHFLSGLAPSSQVTGGTDASRPSSRLGHLS